MKIESGYRYDESSGMNHLIIRPTNRDYISIGHESGPSLEVEKDEKGVYYDICTKICQVKIYPHTGMTFVRMHGWKDWYAVDDTIFEVKNGE